MPRRSHVKKMQSINYLQFTLPQPARSLSAAAYPATQKARQTLAGPKHPPPHARAGYAAAGEPLRFGNIAGTSVQHHHDLITAAQNSRLAMPNSFLKHTGQTPIPAAWIAGVIVVGLALDQAFEFWGQAITNLVVWALFVHWVVHARAEERIMLASCIVYATLGEIFLALAWGLYDYRLGNIPLFVPPGHVLLFMLGRELAPHLAPRMVALVPLAAAPFVAWLAMSGADTLGLPLFGIFLLCIVFGAAKRLYATMFVLALAMELYGTGLGNWTWHAQEPWLGFTTLNPPLAAGAFYCVLDLLVMSTLRAWRARRVAVAPLSA